MRVKEGWEGLVVSLAMLLVAWLLIFGSKLLFLLIQ
jgi:hypothetical protein